MKNIEMIDEKGNSITCEYGKCGGATGKEDNYNSFKECNCNNCINRVIRMEEFKKGDKFMYENFTVEIKSFCPLLHCADIMLGGIEYPTFGKWINLGELRKCKKITNN